MEETDSVQGTVTALCPQMLEMQLNITTTVSIAHLVAKHKASLPKIGQFVHFKGHIFKHIASSTYFICPECKLSGQFCDTREFDKFQICSFINEFYLGFSDLIAIGEKIKLFKHLKPFSSQNSIADFYEKTIIDVYQKSLEDVLFIIGYDNFNHEILFDAKFLPLNIISVSKLDLNQSCDKTDYSFTAFKPEKNTRLVGVLDLSCKNCLPYLRDCSTTLSINIVPYCGKKLKRVLGNLVMVKDYILVTEFYKNKIGECLFVKDSDLVVLQESFRGISYFSPSPALPKSTSILFHLESVSGVHYSAQHGADFFAKGSLAQRSECVLKLSRKNAMLQPFLRNGTTYRITLPGSNIEEILRKMRLQPFKPFVRATNISDLYLAPSEAHFEEEGPFEGAEEPRDCVEGIVADKAILDDTVFERAGETHKLNVVTSNAIAAVYLNKKDGWEFPPGVIPGAKVLIQNLLSNSKHVFRSTFLTSIRILDIIEQKILVDNSQSNIEANSEKKEAIGIQDSLEAETKHLDNAQSYGSECSTNVPSDEIKDLSLHEPKKLSPEPIQLELEQEVIEELLLGEDLLPEKADKENKPKARRKDKPLSGFFGPKHTYKPGTVVAGEVFQVKILLLKIEHICQKCKETQTGVNLCTCGGKLRPKPTLITQLSDSGGRAKMITKELDVIRELLALTVTEWCSILRVFNKTIPFQFYYSMGDKDKYSEATSDERVIFCKELHDYCALLNDQCYRTVCIEARRLRDNDSKDPFWYCFRAFYFVE